MPIPAQGVAPQPHTQTGIFPQMPNMPHMPQLPQMPQGSQLPQTSSGLDGLTLTGSACERLRLILTLTNQMKNLKLIEIAGQCIVQVENGKA